MFNVTLKCAYPYAWHLKPPFVECTQEIQFGIPRSLRWTRQVKQNESRRGVRSLNEIQTGFCGAYRLRFHPQRLVRRLGKRVGAPFLSHASVRISITGADHKRHWFRTRRALVDLWDQKPDRIEIKQTQRYLISSFHFIRNIYATSKISMFR